MEIYRPPLERPRAVMLDIDGTVTPGLYYDYPSGKVLGAIVRTQRLGVPVTFNTGRYGEETLDIIRNAGIISPASVEHGNKVISPQGDILWENPNKRWDSQNKGEGLLIVANFLGIDPKDFITAGDDEPDIDMFRESGWGAAVFDATKKTLNIADGVIPTALEHGVAHLLDEYVIKRVRRTG